MGQFLGIFDDVPGPPAGNDGRVPRWTGTAWEYVDVYTADEADDAIAAAVDAVDLSPFARLDGAAFTGPVSLGNLAFNPNGIVRPTDTQDTVFYNETVSGGSQIFKLRHGDKPQFPGGFETLAAIVLANGAYIRTGSGAPLQLGGTVDGITGDVVVVAKPLIATAGATVSDLAEISDVSGGNASLVWSRNGERTWSMYRSTADRSLRLYNAEIGFDHLQYKIDGSTRLNGRLDATAGAMITGDAAASGTVNTDSWFTVSGVQVVGPQGAAVADATDLATVITSHNALLARCRAHGLIAA